MSCNTLVVDVEKQAGISTNSLNHAILILSMIHTYCPLIPS